MKEAVALVQQVATKSPPVVNPPVANVSSSVASVVERLRASCATAAKSGGAATSTPSGASSLDRLRSALSKNAGAFNRAASNLSLSSLQLEEEAKAEEEKSKCLSLIPMVTADLLETFAFSGGARAWVEAHDWSHIRNFKEAQNLAALVDRILASLKKVGGLSEVLEEVLQGLCGRLTTLVLADDTGSWHFGELLDPVVNSR